MKMKNNFLFLVCLGLVLLSSCKDDDKDPFKNYSVDYTGSKLALTFNGKEMTGKAVSFRSLNQDNATLALKGMIPGEDSLVINMPVVALGNDDFSFEGENKNADRTVGVKGEVKGGVLNLNTTFKVTSKVVGKWMLDAGMIDGMATTICIHLEIVTDVDSITLPIFGRLPINPVEEDGMALTTMIKALGGMMLPNVLTKIELKEDGNLIATYRGLDGLLDPEASPEITSEEGLVRYNVKDGQIYLLIDIASLLAKSEDPFAGVSQMLASGIPLKLQLDGDKMKAYVDKDMMVPFMSILESLKPMIDELDLSSVPEAMKITHESLKFLIDEVVNLVRTSSKVELGLLLAPYVEAAPSSYKMYSPKMNMKMSHEVDNFKLLIKELAK